MYVMGLSEKLEHDVDFLIQYFQVYITLLDCAFKHRIKIKDKA